MLAIELQGIAKGYGTSAVLRGVDLAVEAGSFLVVFGPPACGKSVLVRLLTGLERPDAGSLRLRGRDATGQSPAERNIGYVPQSFALYPHYSVHDNIAYPLTLMRLPRRDTESQVRRVAEQLSIAHLLDKRPDQLSGGEKQRVALARGIVKPSDLFVLDDPLIGLDFKLREQLFDDLKRMQQELAATFVYMTSDALEALALADRIAVLDGGRVLEEGPVVEVYERPRALRTMELLGVPPSNRLAGVLRRRAGGICCEAGLFELAFRPGGDGTALEDPHPVEVAIRPQDLLLGGGDGLVTFPARVVLEEDLGAEAVIFLRAGETPLVTVAPQVNRTPYASDESVKVGVRPSAAVVFDARTGLLLGRGA